MHAHTVEAAQWWERPRGDTSAHWIATYQQSLKARHRTQIVQIMQTLRPTSVLEVGAHCGPNLVRLAQDCPWIEQLTGIDVNADAVAGGQRWVSALGLSERISLVQGRVPEKTDGLASGCVDVVLSCYALAYIAPPDLDAVLAELGRLATTAIVLAEPQIETGVSQWNGGVTGYSEWAHPYQQSGTWMPSWRGLTSRIEPVSPPVDRLNGILVAARANTRSTAATTSRRT